MIATCPECGASTQTRYCEHCKMFIPDEIEHSNPHRSHSTNLSNDLSRLGLYGNCGIYTVTRKRIRLEPLASLTDRQKACLIARKFFNLRRSEIASLLHIDETTVRTHISNALKRLNPDDLPYLRNIVVKQSFAWVLANVVGYSAEQTGRMLGIESATVRQHVKREEDRRNGKK